MTVEIILQPDGTVLVPRGTKAENDVVRKLFNGLVNPIELNNFLSMSDESHVVFGVEHLCG